MPCTNDGYPEEPPMIHGMTIEQLNALACVLLSIMENHNLGGEEYLRAEVNSRQDDSGISGRDFAKWRKLHSAEDRERKLEEAREAMRERLLKKGKSMLDSLSKEDRAAIELAALAKRDR